MLDSALQSLNTPSPIYVVQSGMLAFLRFELARNALSAIDKTPSPNSTLLILQPLNAYLSINRTLCGIEMLLILLQELKQCCAMHEI